MDMICIMGPTASGKTRFAVELAKQIALRCKRGELPYNGSEIISADSRQVYRGMDIGTGKDLAEYDGVGYHLIDIVEAGTKYDLFQYKRDFQKVYNELVGRNLFPILCGGSGLYIEAVCKNYDLKEVAPDSALRASLEGKSMEELIAMLTELKRSKGVVPHNNTDFDTKKRVVRAIEIELNSQDDNSLCKKQAEDSTSSQVSYSEFFYPKEIMYVALNPDREVRNARIDRRLEQRLKEGLVEEVQGLLNSGIAADDLIYYGLEYKFITQYLIGQISYDYMREHLAIAIHQFAKRQMTWLRGMERRGINIIWGTGNSSHLLKSILSSL